MAAFEKREGFYLVDAMKIDLQQLYLNKAEQKKYEHIDEIALYIFMRNRDDKIVVDDIYQKLNNLEVELIFYKDYTIYNKGHPLKTEYLRINNVTNFIRKYNEKDVEILPKLTSEYIDSVYYNLLPSVERVEEIKNIIKMLKSAIPPRDDYILTPIGSISNGLFLNSTSDIDLTLIIKNLDPDEHVLPQYNLNKLINSLRPVVDNENINYHVTKRKAQVIDFGIDGYETQILINNYYSMLNTELIRFYSEFDSRFHKLAFFIKWWVSQRKEELRFSKKFKLNSFSLVSMLVVYLQDVEDPPILPKIITTSPDGLRYDLELDVAAHRSQLDRQNDKELVEIYRGFVNYYFNGGFDYLHEVVNTADGGIEPYESVLEKIDKDEICSSNVFEIEQKKELKMELKKSAIAIIDPFDHGYGPSSSFKWRPFESGEDAETTLEKMKLFIDDLHYDQILI